MTTSEAKFSATGVWMGDANANTRLDFKLDISDAGNYWTFLELRKLFWAAQGDWRGK
ncbi:MAG: hypothetical protein IPN04_07040 [Rhodoferax sp.]|nr:hypothetical protein [Rhodoferax sp.]